jgi:hypothetical protein
LTGRSSRTARLLRRSTRSFCLVRHPLPLDADVPRSPCFVPSAGPALGSKARHCFFGHKGVVYWVAESRRFGTGSEQFPPGSARLSSARSSGGNPDPKQQARSSDFNMASALVPLLLLQIGRRCIRLRSAFSLWALGSQPFVPARLWSRLRN